jgi:predicted DNA-binding transcriptional regulator AlpA
MPRLLVGDEHVSNTSSPDDLLAVPEVCSLLKTSAATLTRLRSRSNFPAPQILARNHNGTPRLIAWRRRDLEDWQRGQGR